MTPRRMCSLFARALPVLLLLSLGGVVVRAGEGQDMEAGLKAGQAAADGESLASLLHRASRLETFDVSTLYDPPAPQEHGRGFRLLGHGRVTLNLVHNATAFDASGVDAAKGGLAVGRADGSLQVFGPLACPRLRPPDVPADEDGGDDESGELLDAGAVTMVAYGSGSRYLAAVHTGLPGVSLFDLEDCDLDRRLDVHGVVSMAMSESGGWLALAAADGRVLAGPPGGKLAPVPLSLPSMLGVGFGPEGGVLYAVARSGETVVWDLVHGQELARFKPRGGPFVSVRFQGRFMGLVGDNGRLTALDLVAREQVPYTRQLARFFIQDDTLRYRTFSPILRTRRWEGTPALSAWHSPALGMVRVRDLDAAERCHDAATGLPRPCVTAPDWQPLDLTQFGGFFLGEAGYRLADVVHWWDHDVLLSRHVPGQGWFLWWVRAERMKEYSPLPGYLPQRESIRSDHPAVWAPVTPPPYYP